MQRRAWRSGAVGVLMAASASASEAQLSGVGRVQLASSVRIGVPAVAVLTAATQAMGTPTPSARLSRWRAVLRTGANDRHALSILGLRDGWTVRVADASTALPSTGGEVVVATALARGYHDIVLVLEGPATREPPIEAVVRTLDVQGGLAVAPLRPLR